MQAVLTQRRLEVSAVEALRLRDLGSDCGVADTVEGDVLEVERDCVAGVERVF